MKLKQDKPLTTEQKNLVRQIVELNDIVHDLGNYLQKHLDFTKNNPALHAYPIRLYLEEKDLKLTITAIDNEMKRLRIKYNKSIDDAIEQLRKKQSQPQKEETIEEAIENDMKKSKLGE